MINQALIKKYCPGNMTIEDYRHISRTQIVRDAWEQSEDIEEAEAYADTIAEALAALEKENT